jgi:hypothetical protein
LPFIVFNSAADYFCDAVNGHNLFLSKSFLLFFSSIILDGLHLLELQDIAEAWLGNE